MDEQQKPEVHLMRQLFGDVLTGVPVYRGSYQDEKYGTLYSITISVPQTIQERIYRAQLKMYAKHYTEETKTHYIWNADGEESYWGYKLETVIRWIEDAAGVEIIYNAKESY